MCNPHCDKQKACKNVIQCGGQWNLTPRGSALLELIPTGNKFYNARTEMKKGRWEERGWPLVLSLNPLPHSPPEHITRKPPKQANKNKPRCFIHKMRPFSISPLALFLDFSVHLCYISNSHANVLIIGHEKNKYNRMCPKVLEEITHLGVKVFVVGRHSTAQLLLQQPRPWRRRWV